VVVQQDFKELKNSFYFELNAVNKLGEEVAAIYYVDDDGLIIVKKESTP